MTIMPTYDRRPQRATPRKAKAAAPRAPSPNDAIRDRIIDRIRRVVRMQLIAMNRDWESCGKRACKRTRRCRGVACDAMYEP